MSEYLSRLDFAWPLAWLLILLPLLGRYILPQERLLKETVRVPFLPLLIDELNLESQPERPSRVSQLLFWAVWFLLVSALSRPEYLSPPQQVIKPMRNIVLLLDVSGSMAKNDAQDGKTRLATVQETVRAFIEKRKTDRIGLVIFGAKAWPFAPLSEDKKALLARINQLKPGMAGEQTAIGDALGVAVKVLESATETDASKLAILLTDGNDTASQLPPPQAAQLAADHHVQVHTIAFGDINSSGEDKVDVKLMQDIARITGGKTWRAATSGDALSNIWKEIDALTPVQVKTLGWSWHLPLFMWPLGMALLLLVACCVVRFSRQQAQS